MQTINAEIDHLRCLLKPGLRAEDFHVCRLGEPGYEASFLAPGETLDCYNFDEDKATFAAQRDRVKLTLERLAQIDRNDRPLLAGGADPLAPERVLSARRPPAIRRAKDWLRRYYTSLKASFRVIRTRRHLLNPQNSTKDEYFNSNFESVHAFLKPLHMYLDGKYQGRTHPNISLSYRWMATVKEVAQEHRAASVFEFGCGAGRNIIALKKLFSGRTTPELVGIDYSLSRALNGQMLLRRLGLKDDKTWIWAANGLRLPFKDGAFDVSFSAVVIEQMKGYEEQAISEILRVTKKAAIFFERSLREATIGDRYWLYVNNRSVRHYEVLAARKDVRIIRSSRPKDYPGPCNTHAILTVVEKVAR